MKVENGFVTLEGDVDYKYQIAAQNAVRNLAGVKAVINLINVKPVVTPLQVKIKIENALRRTAELDAQQIRVDVHDARHFPGPDRIVAIIGSAVPSSSTLTTTGLFCAAMTGLH